MMHRSLVAFALLVVAAAGMAPAHALTTPKLKLVVTKKGDASLRWTFSGAAKKDPVTIEIEESLDGTPFLAWDLFDRAKRKQTVALDDLDPGVHRWRARAIDSDELTGWSGIVALEVEAPPTSTGDPPLAAGQRECPDGWIAEVLRLANEHRQAYGLAPLADHPLLATAARTRAIDMAAARRLSHDGWTAVIQATGYRGRTLGENIAEGYGSPASVVSGWMASTYHRANILRSTFRDSGVGCVVDSRGRPWWAHDFGG